MKIVISIRSGTIFAALLLYLVWMPQIITALDPAKPLSQYKRVHWDEEKGLPSSLITTMTQTRDGYLWFGTQEGLVRFNGFEFKVFEPNNTPTLKGKIITQVFEDSSGRLWIATNKGLHLYQDQKEEFSVYTTENGLSKDFVVTLYEDRSGRLWIGTVDALSCLKDEKITTYDFSTVIPNGRIRSIGESDNGDIWVGTTIGLVQFRDNQFKIFTEAEGISEKLIRVIYRDAENILWIGTDNGLFRLENDSFIQDKRFEGKTIHLIKKDKSGALWVGGSFGFSRITTSGIETMESRKELSSGVYTMLEDSEGSVWISTESEGLLQFIDGKFGGYSTLDGMLSDVSYSIFQTAQKDVWITTQNGINRFRNNAFDLKLTSQNGLPNTRFSAINADDSGNLWIGTTKGLLRWQNDRLANIKGLENLAKKNIQVLYRDPENNLWIGTNSGLSFIGADSKANEIISIDQSEQFAKSNIFVITGSLSKGLWIGTSKGLWFLKNNQLLKYTKKDGLADDTVMSLYEDDSGVLWIGTFGNGLSRFKENKLASVNTRNGLFNDTVFVILPDEHGNLWMSCNRGIFRLTKISFDEFIDGKRQTVDSVGYGVADGMKSAEPNGGFQPAGLKADDGKLWFPTVKGVVVINPNNISMNLKPPPIHIEGLTADSIAVPLGEQKTLPAGTQRLEFHFAAMSFIMPDKVHYRYRLEGFDNDWIDAENRHKAFYTNLPPGQYTFRVIAANNDGVWNETGTNFPFQINPHFYQTRWFLTVSIIALGGLIAALHFRRVRSLRLRHEAVLDERYRIARELHDTLLQGFVGVSSQLSVVAAQFRETPEIAERHLKVARDMIRHSVTEARRSVQNLRSSETENETFTQILKKNLERVTLGTSLKTEIEINGKPFEIPSDITHQLLHIVDEAAVNTIKHAAAVNLKIVCSFNAPGIRLEIIDDGKGFDQNTAFSTLNGHFGMIGMLERAEKAGGKLTIKENAPTGTKIVFENLKVKSILNNRFARLIVGIQKKLRDKRGVDQ